MNGSTTLTNPETAPRSIDELKKVGIFQLRLLTERLGGLQTPEQNQAFFGLNLEQKAQYAHQLLTAWDKSGGAAAMPPQVDLANGDVVPSATNSAPFGLMPMNDPTIHQPLPFGHVSPPFDGFPQTFEGTSSVTATPNVAAATTGRKPRTTKADAERAMEVGADALREDIAQLTTTLGRISNVLADCNAGLTALEQSTKVLIALSLSVGANALRASKPDLLAAAVAHTPAIAGFLKALEEQ